MTDRLATDLAWFRTEWANEIPERLHTSGVEWTAGDGGSRLGTPRWAEGFRRYIVDPRDYAVEYAVYDNVNQTDPHYVRPLRCAIAWLAHHRHPLMARWLFRLGTLDGQWAAVADSFTVPHEYGEAITRTALVLVRRAYMIRPDDRRAEVA